MKSTGWLLYFSHIPPRPLSWLGLVFLVVMPAASTGCQRHRAEAPTAAAPAEQAIPTVTVVNPERKTVRRTISQPGYIQAFEQAPILSKIAGYVQKMNVDIGDRVSKGQVLAELWVPEMEVDVAQKEALVFQSEAEIKQAKEAATVAEADLASSEAKLRAAESTSLRAEAHLQHSQSQLERLSKAGRSGVIGREDVEDTRLSVETSKAGLEEVKAQIQSAKADRDASRAKRDKAKADVVVAEARLQVAQRNRDMAKTMLEYRGLTAPFEGVVTQRNIDIGHFVQPATGAKGEPLFVVKRTELMRIKIEVPEAEADWVTKDVAASVRIQALKKYEFTGKVARTSWSLDQTAHTLLAEIDVPDPTGNLRPGMYVYAAITAEVPNALTLPSSAVLTEGDVNQGYRTFCFIVENGKAYRTPIEIGVRDPQSVQVVKKQTRPAQPGEKGQWVDFTDKDAVIQASVPGLTDGQPVTVAPTKK